MFHKGVKKLLWQNLGDLGNLAFPNKHLGKEEGVETNLLYFGLVIEPASNIYWLQAGPSYQFNV